MPTPPRAASPIGLVGAGLVGQALATRLLQAGWRVVGTDLSAPARAALQGLGAEVVGQAQAVGAACDTVLLAVFDTGDALAVLEGDGGLLSAGHRVARVIDCSTGTPELLEPLAGRLQARGIDFIEAPLSGSSTQIAAGEATQLLGGQAQAIAACGDLLQAIATRRVHVGGAGMAARAKLATNLVLGLNRAALAEGLAFAEALGIAPQAFLDLVLATPARSAAAEAKGERMVAGHFEPESRIRQHLKDVQLMLEGARRAGQPLPLTQAHAALLQQAVDAGDGDLDNAAIVRRWRAARSPSD